MSVLASSSTASQVYPGLIGFLVVAGMGLALYFLFRSMNKQLHKIAPGQPSSAPPGTAGRRGPVSRPIAPCRPTGPVRPAILVPLIRRITQDVGGCVSPAPGRSPVRQLLSTSP